MVFTRPVRTVTFLIQRSCRRNSTLLPCTPILAICPPRAHDALADIEGLGDSHCFHGDVHAFVTGQLVDSVE